MDVCELDQLAASEHGDDDNSAFISTAGETVSAIIDDLFKPSCSSHSSGESVADEKIHQLLSSYNEIYSPDPEKSLSDRMRSECPVIQVSRQPPPSMITTATASPFVCVSER